MDKIPFHNSNKFARIDRLQPFQKSRRELTRSYYNHRRPPNKKLIIRVIGVIAGLLILQSIFQLPWLKINNIVIQGLSQVPEQSVRQDIQAKLDERRFLIFKNNNYFIFKSGDLSEKLVANYFLDNISIKKSFPHTVEITAQERISPFVRQTPDAYYVLSYSGEIKEKTAEPPAGTSIIADERQDTSSNIPFKYLESVSKLVEQWDINEQQLIILKFHLTDEPDQIIASTDRGYRLIFSTTEEYSKQITRLKEILAQNILPQDIQYVDLRFENNVYFK